MPTSAPQTRIPLPWATRTRIPARSPSGRGIPRTGYRLSLEWHNPKTEPRDGMDRVQGRAFALSSRPEDKPAELLALWAALGGPGCGFMWCSAALGPPPQRHTPERWGRQRAGNLKRRVERTIGPLFSEEVIAEATALKPGYYAGEEVSPSRAAFVEDVDARQAAEWKEYVAWYRAQPLL